MEALLDSYLVVVHTYSEFPQLKSTDLNTPFHLDPAAVLTAEAAKALHNDTPTAFNHFVLSTNIRVDQRNPHSPLIARAMEMVITRSADSPIVPIQTYVCDRGTSTTDEIRAAKGIAITAPLLSVCMDYHRDRVALNLKRELGLGGEVCTTEEILKSLAPEVLEPYKSWLDGPEHQSRVRREAIAYRIDSNPVGHLAMEAVNSLTGGRGLNQAILRFV